MPDLRVCSRANPFAWSLREVRDADGAPDLARVCYSRSGCGAAEGGHPIASFLKRTLKRTGTSTSL